MGATMLSHLAAATTTTLVNVHLGRALPAARVIIVAVPLGALALYALVRTRRRGA